MVAGLAAMVVVGVVLQRSAGLGFAAILAPVAVLFLGPVDGVIVVNLLSVLSTLLILPSVWSRVDWRRCAWIVALGIPGSLLGTALTVVLDRAWLEMAIGLILLAGLLVTALMPSARLEAERPVLRAVSGATAGFMSSAAGAGGPVILMYATVAKWPFTVLAATLQPYFIVVSGLAFGAKIVIHPEAVFALDLVGWVVIGTALVVGAFTAHVLGGRIPVRVCRIIAFAIASAGAAAALIRGVLAVAA